MADRILHSHQPPLRVLPRRPSVVLEGRNADAPLPEGRPAPESTTPIPCCRRGYFPPFPVDVTGWLRFARSALPQSLRFQLWLLRLAFLCQALLVLGLTCCSIRLNKGTVLLLLLTVLVWLAVERGLHLAQSTSFKGSAGLRGRQHAEDVTLQPCVTVALLCELITPQVAVWILDLPAKTVLTSRLLSSSICRLLSIFARLSPADLFLVSTVDVGLSIGAVTSLRRWASFSEDVTLLAAASAALLFSGIANGLSNRVTAGLPTGLFFPFSEVSSRWSEPDSTEGNRRYCAIPPEHDGNAAKRAFCGPGYTGVFYVEERRRFPHIVSQDKSRNLQSENCFPVASVGQHGDGDGHPFPVRVNGGVDSEMSSHTTTTHFSSHQQTSVPAVRPSVLSMNELLSDHLDPGVTHSLLSPRGAGNSGSPVCRCPLRKVLPSLHNGELHDARSWTSPYLTGPKHYAMPQKHRQEDLWSSKHYANKQQTASRTATDVAGIVLRASDVLILSSLERCGHTIQTLATRSVPRVQGSGDGSSSEVDCRLLSEGMLVECHHLADELELIHKNLVGILRLLGRCSPGCPVSSEKMSNHPTVDQKNYPIPKQQNPDLWKDRQVGRPLNRCRRGVRNIQATCPACGSSDLLRCVCVAIDQACPFELYHCMDLLKRATAVISEATSVVVQVSIGDDVDSLASDRYGGSSGNTGIDYSTQDKLGSAGRLTLERNANQGRTSQPGETSADRTDEVAAIATTTQGVCEPGSSSCERDVNDRLPSVRMVRSQKELWLEGHEKELLVVLQSLIAAVSAAASPGDEVTVSVGVDTERVRGCREHADDCSGDSFTGYTHLGTEDGGRDEPLRGQEFDIPKGRSSRKANPFFVALEEQTEPPRLAFCFTINLHSVARGVSRDKTGVTENTNGDRYEMAPHLLATVVQECLHSPRCVHPLRVYDTDNHYNFHQMQLCGTRGHQEGTTDGRTCGAVQRGMDWMSREEHENRGLRSRRQGEELRFTKVPGSGAPGGLVAQGRWHCRCDGWVGDKAAAQQEKLDSLSSVIRFCHSVIERRFGGHLGTSCSSGPPTDLQTPKRVQEKTHVAGGNSVEAMGPEIHPQMLMNLLSGRRRSEGDARKLSDQTLRVEQRPSQDGFSIFFVLPFRRCPQAPGASSSCDCRFAETGYGGISGREGSQPRLGQTLQLDVKGIHSWTDSPRQGQLWQSRRPAAEKDSRLQTRITKWPWTRREADSETRAATSGAGFGNCAVLCNSDGSPVPVCFFPLPQASRCPSEAHPAVCTGTRTAVPSVHLADVAELIGSEIKGSRLTWNTERPHGAVGPLGDSEGQEQNVQEAVREHDPFREMLKERGQHRTREDGEETDGSRSGLSRGNEKGETPGRGSADSDTPTGSTLNTGKCTATREFLLDLALRHTSKKRSKYSCGQDSDRTGSNNIDKLAELSSSLLPFGDAPSWVPCVSSDRDLFAELGPKNGAGNYVRVPSTQAPVSCGSSKGAMALSAVTLLSPQTTKKRQMPDQDTATVEVNSPWREVRASAALGANCLTSDKSIEKATRAEEGDASYNALLAAGTGPCDASSNHACSQTRDSRQVHVRTARDESTPDVLSSACRSHKRSPQASTRALRHSSCLAFSSSDDEAAFSAAADALFEGSMCIDRGDKDNAKMLSVEGNASQDRVEGVGKHSNVSSKPGALLPRSQAETRQARRSEGHTEEVQGKRAGAGVDRETNNSHRVVQSCLSGGSNLPNTVGFTGLPSLQRISGSGHCVSTRRKSDSSLAIPSRSFIGTGRPPLESLQEESEPWSPPTGSNKDRSSCSEVAAPFQSVMTTVDSQDEPELRRSEKGKGGHNRTNRMESGAEGDQKNREFKDASQTGLTGQSDVQKTAEPAPETDVTTAVGDPRACAGEDAVRMGPQPSLAPHTHGMGAPAVVLRNSQHVGGVHSYVTKGTQAMQGDAFVDQLVGDGTKDRETPANAIHHIPLLRHSNAKSRSLHDELLLLTAESRRTCSTRDKPETGCGTADRLGASCGSLDKVRYTESTSGEGYDPQCNWPRGRSDDLDTHAMADLHQGVPNRLFLKSETEELGTRCQPLGDADVDGVGLRGDLFMPARNQLVFRCDGHDAGQVKQTAPCRRGEVYEAESDVRGDRTKRERPRPSVAACQPEGRSSPDVVPRCGSAPARTGDVSSALLDQDESEWDCGNRDSVPEVVLTPLSVIFPVPSEGLGRRENLTGENGTPMGDPQDQASVARRRQSPGPAEEGTEGDTRTIRFGSILSSMRTPAPSANQRVPSSQVEGTKETTTHSALTSDVTEELSEEDQQERRWMQLQQEEQQLRTQLNRTKGLLESLAARRKKTPHSVQAETVETPPLVALVVQTSGADSNANMEGSKQEGGTGGEIGEAGRSDEERDDGRVETPFILTRSLDAEGHDKVVLAASRGWSPRSSARDRTLASSPRRDAQSSPSSQVEFTWDRARYRGFSGSEEELFPSVRARANFGIPGGKAFLHQPVVWGRQGAIGANGTPMIVPRKLRGSPQENGQDRTYDSCGFVRAKPQVGLSIYGTPVTAARTVGSGLQELEEGRSGPPASTSQWRYRDSGGTGPQGHENRTGSVLGFRTAQIPMGLHGTPMTEPRFVRPRNSHGHRRE
ncbi:conserved hypothetical protein [Neospora caninum Liverpool]|uniref:Transmembrane protein n=1 Tax=Neospora caninum (strain Liverpool) TaxID=572307 RepID=F0VQ58_NEOCL|nr:conserved hypothetical protein [Neospora caninum Liverpool]CBZ55855.1 conserved hypothetical protein [Neospora caninum Liverpool]CEL70599.1 TPA: hypothetical protein BN1204_062810 [Neospora caninum Liverpool]|eukprot:XP_003885881.1 conserved hypothetical protein [Neospora caninum Liverpool]